MNILTDDISSWAKTLEDFQPEYKAIPVWTPLQAYRLIGKKTVIELDNFEPIPDLHYALFSPKEGKYYLKEFPDIPMWLMLFYKTDEDWDSYDTFLNSFRRYVSDGNIFLLLTPEQVKDTSNKLERIGAGNHLPGDGKLDYRLYLKIVKEVLDYESYKDKCKNLTGFKTVCNQFEIRISELWKEAIKLKELLNDK